MRRMDEAVGVTGKSCRRTVQSSRISAVNVSTNLISLRLSATYLTHKLNIEVLLNAFQASIMHYTIRDG